MPNIIDDALRGTASTEDEILIAVRNRLREAIQELNEQNCFISDQPLPCIVPGGGRFVSISPGGGDFDEENFDGGAHCALTDDGQIIVTHAHQVVLDQTPKAEEAIAHINRGLVVWKRLILKALLVVDPELCGASDVWEPARFPDPLAPPSDTNLGIPLLRDQIRPVRYTEPMDAPCGPGWIAQQIFFRRRFDWELYE